ncbi:MAG: GAF domain-containing protein, partial [Leptolyngbyaceae bacterium]|nr:GAF domain-containing protein [Leptolyngbyaceae bacterium]
MVIRATLLTQAELTAAVIRSPLVVTPDTTVMDAIAQMSGVRTLYPASSTVDSQMEGLQVEERSSCVIVVENNKLLGILTERDVVRLSAQQPSFEELPIREVMTSSVITLRESALTDFFEVVRLLQQHHIRHLPILDEQDRLVGLLTYESLQQEQRVQERTAQLREREAQLEDFFDNANDLIQSVRLGDGRFEYVNRAWRETLGYSEAEVAQLTIFDVMHPAYHEHCQILLTQMQGGTICTLDRMELTFLTKDRREILVEGSLNCRLENDRPVTTRAIFRNITERKATERLLQEREARYRALMDYASDAILLADSKGNLIECNRKAEELLGYSREELTHLHISQIHPPEVLEATYNHFSNIVLHDQGSVFETLVVRKDGIQIPVDITGSRIELNGKPIAQGIFRDIRARKQAEQIIRQQAEREILLREITQRIRQSLDLQTIFDTACQEIYQVFQADRVGVFKFYPESGYDDGEFVAESVVHGIPSVLAIRIHDHCFGENYAPLYAQGRYSAIADIDNHGLEVCHTAVLAQFQVRASLVLPLLCGDDLWGLLCIHHCTNSHHWHPSEIALGHQLANQLAIAIQQATLYEQIQSELQVRKQAEARIAQQLRQQQTLGTIIQHIRESLDLNEILSTVTQQVKDVLQGDRVIVFRLFPDGHSQIVEESVSSGLPTLKNLHWEDEIWSQDILDMYWQGQPRIVADVMNDIWTDCLVDYSKEGQIQSKMVAPILQDVEDYETHRWVAPWETNKLWGIVVVHACREQRSWQESEVQLLQQIANQLAIAIHQANLFEQLQQELTERQQAQQQLTERNQELARATRLKDEFLANMSHELRTPLNAILGMTEGLQEEVFGSVTQPQIKALGTIEGSASHLLALINDILDVAKIESGQIELEYSSVSLMPLCSSSLAFIKQQAFKKRIQLETQISPNLPPLWVDERRIRQVLINLLTNAVKF